MEDEIDALWIAYAALCVALLGTRSKGEATRLLIALTVALSRIKRARRGTALKDGPAVRRAKRRIVDAMPAIRRVV